MRLESTFITKSGIARRVALLSVAFALGACSGLNKQATSLGAAGQSAAGDYAGLYGKLDAEAASFYTLKLYQTPRAFACRPRDRACEKARQRFFEAIEKQAAPIARIRKSLSLRVAVFQSLTKTYAAFLELNNTDVRADFEKNLTNLTTAIGAFAKQSGYGPIPEFAGGIVARFGGIFITFAKVTLLRNASRRLRERVSTIHAVVTRDARLNRVLYRRVENARFEAVRRLWRSGAVRIDPVIKSVIGDYPVQPVTGDRGVSYRSRSGVTVAFEEHLVAIHEQRLKAFNALQAKLLQALSGLIDAHKKFEAGSKPKFDDLMILVMEIKHLVETMQLAK